MRILKISIITAVIGILVILPIAKYIHAKTLGKGITDCMIEYIDKYYPIGESYMIDNKYPHIDKRGLSYLNPTGEVDGCIFHTSNFVYNSINTPYCYWTLILEK